MVIDDLGVRTSDRKRVRAASSCASTPTTTCAVVADDLDFPNGMVISPTAKTLIVAESTGRRLTAFTIGDDGSLSDRRVFADGLDGPPDGIALDAEGGVWTAMTLAHQFERIMEGGKVTDRIDIGDRTAIACTLGGPERRTLFLLTSTDAYPATTGRDETVSARRDNRRHPWSGSADERFLLRARRRRRRPRGETVRRDRPGAQHMVGRDPARCAGVGAPGARRWSAARRAKTPG